MLSGQLNIIQSFKNLVFDIYSSTNISPSGTISSIILIPSDTSKPQNLLKFLSVVSWKYDTGRMWETESGFRKYCHDLLTGHFQ